MSHGDLSHERGAIRIRPHEVEHERGEGFALVQRESLLHGAGDGDAKTRLAEIVRDHPGEPGIVVDHEDLLDAPALDRGAIHRRRHLPKFVMRPAP